MDYSEMKPAGRGHPEKKQHEGVYIEWGPPLPDVYNVDRLAGMARDPHYTFFYWELTGPKSSSIARKLGEGAMLILRITNHDTGNIVDFFPTENPGAWYFKTEPSSTYSAVIGYVTESGELHAVAESGIIRTPADSPRPRPDRTEEQERLLARLLGEVSFRRLGFSPMGLGFMRGKSDE